MTKEKAYAIWASAEQAVALLQMQKTDQNKSKRGFLKNTRRWSML